MGQDKWRNLSVMANGWSSRDKSRLAVRRVQQVPKQDENPTTATSVVPSDEETVDVKASQVPRDMLQIPGPKRSILRWNSFYLYFNGVIH